MSLVFGAATSDRVNCGSAAGIDNVAAKSVLGWIKHTANTNNRRIISKENAADWHMRLVTGGNLTFVHVRATSNCIATTSSTPLATTGKWYCVGGTLDQASGAPVIFVGDFGTEIADVGSYSAQTAGSGAFNSDAGSNLVIGNRDGTADLAFPGQIAIIAFFDRILTVGEMRSWQYRPRFLSGCLGIWYLGSNGTSTQADMSGNGNNGTVTGATLGDFINISAGIDANPDDFFSTAAPALLEGVAGISVTGAGALTTQITMSSAATVAVTGAGALTTQITMAGAANVVVNSVGDITTQITMVGAAAVSITTAGDVTTQITMAAAPTISVSGVGILTTQITMAGVAPITFAATGDVIIANAIAGTGTISVVGAGALTTSIEMASAADISVIAAAALTTQISMAATSSIVFGMVGALITITIDLFGIKSIAAAPTLAGTITAYPLDSQDRTARE